MMNRDEESRYSLLQENVKSEICDTQAYIKELKEELQKARLVRQYRQEYDAMGQIIYVHPSRSFLLHKTKELQDNLDRLHTRIDMLTDLLSLRYKQGHLLVVSLHQLLNSLDNDDLLQMQ